MSRRIIAENIRLKRAYNSAGSGDGTRILIDRLWPRGVRKADAAIDVWAKDIAPSTALRRWFGHDPARWHEFRRRYSEEIHRRRDRLESCVPSLRKDGLHSFLQHVMKLTTTPSS